MNSKDVALLMGVNVSTIKRWTDTNKLPCYQTPGGHRKFTLGHIKEFLNKNNNKIQKVNLIELNGLEDKKLIHHIEHAEYSNLIPIFFKAAIEANQTKVSTIITGLYLKGVQLENIYDYLVFPVMRYIGDLWATGKLTIPEEHLASEVVRKAIYNLGESLTLHLPNDAPSAICFSINGDEHELPLLMTKQILESKGIKTYNLGRSLPTDSIAEMIDALKPNYIFISINYIENENIVNEEINLLCKIISNKKTILFIGGNAINKFKSKHQSMISTINNMQELAFRFN